MHARLTLVRPPSERAAEARKTVSEQFVDRAKEIPGIKGAYFMQHEDGRLFVLTIFEDRSALEGSRENAQPVREAAASATGGTVELVEELEIFASF